jgi:FtsH-binding integral membrane protein
MNRIADNAELRFMAFHDRLIKKITSLLFFGMAAVFFSLGAFYLLKELFSLSDSISFFIIGIILLLIGIFVKSVNRMTLVSN